ncbi:MAG: hypothetical protein ACRC80_18175 [Waterburya sp.]
MSVLNWQSWSFLSKSELIYTFIVILQHMWYWSRQLTPEYLKLSCYAFKLHITSYKKDSETLTRSLSEGVPFRTPILQVTQSPSQS